MEERLPDVGKPKSKYIPSASASKAASHRAAPRPRGGGDGGGGEGGGEGGGGDGGGRGWWAGRFSNQLLSIEHPTLRQGLHACSPEPEQNIHANKAGIQPFTEVFP
eukprot:scaffold88492_cov60-Phaeocystis_antarctica.AAC.2